MCNFQNIDFFALSNSIHSSEYSLKFSCRNTDYFGYCTAFLRRRERSIRGRMGISHAASNAAASAICPCDRYFYCLVSTCSCTFQRGSGSSFSSVSTFKMDTSTKEKCAWQDRKGSRSGHPRNQRKRSAGIKGTNRHDIETDLTFVSTSAAKILKKSPEFEVRIDQTLSYVILEFFFGFRRSSGTVEVQKV